MALDRLPTADTRFQQIALAAPDIGVPLFRQLTPALQSRSDHVTIYSSQRDLALSMSSLVREGPVRVGTRPPAVPGMDVIDATSVKTSLLGHSYFAESPLLLLDLAELLIKRWLPSDRSSTLRRVGQVWVTRDRVASTP